MHLIYHVYDLGWSLFDPELLPILFIDEIFQLIDKTMDDLFVVSLDEGNFVQKWAYHILACTVTLWCLDWFAITYTNIL